MCRGGRWRRRRHERGWKCGAYADIAIRGWWWWCTCCSRCSFRHDFFLKISQVQLRFSLFAPTGRSSLQQVSHPSSNAHFSKRHKQQISLLQHGAGEKLLPHHVRYIKAMICSSEWWLLEQSCFYTPHHSALWDLKAFVQMEETKSQWSGQTVMKSWSETKYLL